ncbi:MAG: MipA/OmpV family protein [Opitutales bacterium]
MRTPSWFRAAALGLLALLPLGSSAQVSRLGLSNMIPDFDEAVIRTSFGVGFAPDFEGSADYDPIPILSVRAEFERYRVEVNGLSGGVDVSPFKGWEFGPAFGFRFGRDDDVDNDVVSLLREIDEAFELGFFVGYKLSPKLLEKDLVAFRATFLHDVTSVHSGFTVGLGATYSFQALRMLRVGLGPTANFADGDYFDTFFSVDAGDAARSGLPAFDADGGLRDVGFNSTATFFYSRKWSITAFVSYRRLVGDASDTPIVDLEGSPNQVTSGLTASYRW